MNKKVLHLAIPNIVSNVTVPLLGMADLAVVGHLSNASNQIGAIAIGGMIFSFIYMTLSFLRASTAGLTAQAYGAENKANIQAVFVRSTFLALLLAGIILLLQIPIEWGAFKILEAEPDVKFFAQQYFNVRIWAAPATLMLYVFNGWFIGMQNTKVPMFIAIIGNILNIVFNYIFVYHLGMNAEGVALGTVVAQYISLFLFVLWTRVSYAEYFKSIQFKTAIVWDKVLALLKMNVDLFIRSFILIFVLSFFTASSAKISTNILAVNSLLFQFFLFYSYFMDGFAYAAEALTGKFIGQSNLKDLKQSVKVVFAWGLGLSLPFTLLYGFKNEWMLSLLTNDLAIIRLASEYHFWIVIVPILTFASFLWDGIYVGAAASKDIRNTMIVSGLVVFLPTYYALSPYYHNHALWFAFSLFMLSRGLLMTIWYKKAILNRIIE